MSTKQSSRKNSKSNISLGSALLLILVVALVRWYGSSNSSDPRSAQSNESAGVAQPTLQPIQEVSASSTESPDAEANRGGAADEQPAAEVELAVATLPPVETEPPAPTETAVPAAEATAENAQVEQPSTRAPPTDTPRPTAIPRPTKTPPPTAAPKPKSTATAAQVRSISGLPLVYSDELPPEAHDTIALIDDNGPFPFYKDGSVFQNRERILPRRPNGYYSEYTVITPGEGDRGARRIVAGEGGELFYTDDHYDSFREVVR